jgi:hypothetical protein
MNTRTYSRFSSTVSACRKSTARIPVAWACRNRRQPVQPQPEVVPGSQHEPKLRRRPHHQQLELSERLGRAQLLRIVDHQHDRVLKRPQILQQPLDNCPAVQVRRDGQRPHQLRPRGRVSQRVGHRDPELLEITLPAPHRDPRRAVRPAALGHPRRQEKCLPAPGRRRYLGDARRSLEPVEQPGFPRRFTACPPAWPGKSLRACDAGSPSRARGLSAPDEHGWEPG